MTIFTSVIWLVAVRIVYFMEFCETLVYIDVLYRQVILLNKWSMSGEEGWIGRGNICSAPILRPISRSTAANEMSLKFFFYI